MGEEYIYNWNVGHWGPGVLKKNATILVLLNLSLVILSYSTLFYSMILHFYSLHARILLTIYFSTGLHLTG